MIILDGNSVLAVKRDRAKSAAPNHPEIIFGHLQRRSPAPIEIDVHIPPDRDRLATALRIVIVRCAESTAAVRGFQHAGKDAATFPERAKNEPYLVRVRVIRDLERRIFPVRGKFAVRHLYGDSLPVHRIPVAVLVLELHLALVTGNVLRLDDIPETAGGRVLQFVFKNTFSTILFAHLYLHVLNILPTGVEHCRSGVQTSGKRFDVSSCRSKGQFLQFLFGRKPGVRIVDFRRGQWPPVVAHLVDQVVGVLIDNVFLFPGKSGAEDNAVEVVVRGRRCSTHVQRVSAVAFSVQVDPCIAVVNRHRHVVPTAGHEFHRRGFFFRAHTVCRYLQQPVFVPLSVPGAAADTDDRDLLNRRFLFPAVFFRIKGLAVVPVKRTEPEGKRTRPRRPFLRAGKGRTAHARSRNSGFALYTRRKLRRLVRRVRGVAFVRAGNGTVYAPVFLQIVGGANVRLPESVFLFGIIAHPVEIVRVILARCRGNP